MRANCRDSRPHRPDCKNPLWRPEQWGRWTIYLLGMAGGGRGQGDGGVPAGGCLGPMPQGSCYETANRWPGENGAGYHRTESVCVRDCEIHCLQVGALWDGCLPGPLCSFSCLGWLFCSSTGSATRLRLPSTLSARSLCRTTRAASLAGFLYWRP